MRSEEAQIGKRVRVREDIRKTNLRGQEGTIAKRWGNPGYPALDVLLVSRPNLEELGSCPRRQ
jgi:hypothetical protein